MASKVNTKFVIILVGAIVALAVGVGGLAAYSLRMSGERNIAAGDQLVLEAEELRAGGDEAEAIEKINDAASQYGRAVNKDPSRRDWLLQWRDTLLRTIPETDVEYRKQYVERYAAALDRLATLDPTAPGPQLEQVLVQEERFRLGTGPDSMQAIADLVTRRIAALPDDSPTAIRLDAIRGLAVTDRAGRESVDGEDLDAALGAMRRFYDAFVESPDGFLQPVPPDLDEAGRSRFVRRARADHDRIGLGIVRWHMTQRDIAQSEGRTQDGVEALARAESILADMIGEGRRHESNARFHALAILIDLLQARDSIIGPAERRAEELRIFEQYAPVVIELLGASEASDLPGNEMLIFVSWFTDDVSRGALADEFERSVVAAPGDPTVLGRAARAMRAMGNLERSIELYAAIRELPRPELSLEGLLLPDAKTSAAFAQVEVNLDLRDIALGQGRSNEADAFLAAAREARDALASEGGVRAVGPVLRANAEVAIAEGKSLQASRLLEEYRAEFGDSSIEVLIQLANLLLEQGTIGEAKSIIEPLVDAQIVNAQGAILLASIYREEGDLGRALQLLEDQARKSASPEEFAEAIARYRQVIAIEGGDTSGDASLDALVRARAAFARRDVEAASGILDELERVEPAAASSPQVILLRVDIANATGDKAGAVAILEQALQQDPDSDVLARVLRLLTSDDRVQLQVDEIEASDLSSIDKELAKYQLLQSAGRTDEALAALDRAEGIDADHPAVIEIRFEQTLERGDLNTAGQIAGRAADINIDGVDGLLYQGRLQLARGEDAAAVRTLQSAIELIPSSVPIRRFLGVAQLSAGQVDDGVDSLRRAYEARRDNVAVLEDYIRALRSLGRLEEARAVLDPGRDPTAIARTNRIATNLWLLLEAQTGNTDRALEERRTYFEADVLSGDIQGRAFGRENALGLMELLVSEGQLGDAEEVFSQVRSGLSPREASRVRVSIALARAAELNDPAAVQDAESAAISEYAAQAEAEANASGEPAPLLDVANLAFNSGRFELGLDVLQSAVPLESAEDRAISRQIALRQAQRANRLENEARSLDAQAQQRASVDPLGAQAIRERAAQARGRATASREQAASVYADVLQSGVEDSTFVIALSLAEMQVELGEFAAASELIERARTQDPDNLNAILLAATLAERRDDRTGARALYNEAVEKQPSNYLPFLRRAIFNRADRARTADVLFDLERVSELRPSLTQGWILRYTVHMETGDADAAFAALREGIDQVPTIADGLARTLFDAFIRADRTADAAALAAERAAADPEDVDWQSIAGRLALQRGAYREALDYFERLSAMPSIANDSARSAEIASLTLDAQLRSGDEIPASELRGLIGLVESLPAEGATGVARTMLLARAYAAIPSERGRVAEYVNRAYEIAAQGSETATPSSLIRSWYQSLFLLVDNAQQALDFVAAVDQAIRDRKTQDPAASIPHPLMVQAIALQSYELRGDPVSDLIARAESMLPAAENDPLVRFELHKRLSSLRQDLGDFTGAVEDGQAALRIIPNDLELLNNVAFFLAKYLDRAEEALPFAQRALQLAPESADVLDTVGVVYMLNGQYSEATTLLERALRFARTQEQRLPANVHLADAMLRSGSPTSAKAYLEAAERLLPVVSEIVREAYSAEMQELRTRLDNG